MPNGSTSPTPLTADEIAWAAELAAVSDRSLSAALFAQGAPVAPAWPDDSAFALHPAHDGPRLADGIARRYGLDTTLIAFLLEWEPDEWADEAAPCGCVAPNSATQAVVIGILMRRLNAEAKS